MTSAVPRFVGSIGPITGDRILVVGDDPGLFEQLEPVGSPLWAVVPVRSAEAAIEILQRQNFDVVLAPVHAAAAPRFDVLAAARRFQPEAARLAVCEEHELDDVVSAGPPAHRMLVNPVEPEYLAAVVMKACLMSRWLKEDRRRRTLGRTSLLPPPPRTYLALTREVERPGAGARDVARVLDRDRELCAAVLRLVNAGHFGLPCPIAAASEAVTYLGVGTLCSLVLAVETLSRRPGADADPEAVQAMQRHSLLCGQIAAVIAGRDRIRAGQAFIAGMLHDVGQIAPQLPESGGAAEHALLGAHILCAWGLPLMISQAVACHHDALALCHESSPVTHAVHIADRLASELGEGCQPPSLDPIYLATRGIDDQQLGLWRGQAAELAAHGPRLATA